MLAATVTYVLLKRNSALLSNERAELAQTCGRFRTTIAAPTPRVFDTSDSGLLADLAGAERGVVEKRAGCA